VAASPCDVGVVVVPIERDVRVRGALARCGRVVVPLVGHDLVASPDVRGRAVPDDGGTAAFALDLDIGVVVGPVDDHVGSASGSELVVGRVFFSSPFAPLPADSTLLAGLADLLVVADLGRLLLRVHRCDVSRLDPSMTTTPTPELGFFGEVVRERVLAVARVVIDRQRDLGIVVAVDMSGLGDGRGGE